MLSNSWFLILLVLTFDTTCSYSMFTLAFATVSIIYFDIEFYMEQIKIDMIVSSVIINVDLVSRLYLSCMLAQAKRA